LSVARRVGVPPDLVAATPVDFAAWEGAMTDDAYSFILSWQRRILECPADDDDGLKRLCDEFFWQHLVKFPIGVVLELKVVGGRRKTEALQRFAQQAGVPLSQCVAIGDSITDAHLLRTVRESGGLAVVFNGNEYALPYGNVGIAATDLRAILPVLIAFAQEGRDGVQQWLQRRVSQDDGQAYYHWLDGDEWQNALPVHRRCRQQVRGQAAKLG
jgi:energy-converting hydrogenase A subunit R